jgi:hypothetical protein
MLPEIHRDHKEGEFLKKSLLVSVVLFRWNREGSPQRDPYGKGGTE